MPHQRYIRTLVLNLSCGNNQLCDARALRDARDAQDKKFKAETLLGDTQRFGHTNVRVLRVWRRSPTHINVELLSPAGRQPGVIQNISRYGAGLTGAFDVSRKDRATLRLSDGRVILVHLRWRIGDRCGLSFIHPLESNDPLLGDARSKSQSWRHTKPSERFGQTKLQSVGGFKSTIFFLIVGLVKSVEQVSRSFLWARNHRAEQRHVKAKQLRNMRMLERACRKQGFSWLVDEDAQTIYAETKQSEDDQSHKATK
jgi:hypothetical protein